ncbi:putative Ig domain-containing protein [Planobispora rosea]|uniref:putative Ig domain-containing protein n=1 Tax=Planobispora rosea TaxID=35762 RepID=UPI000A93A232|nr:putative Ig domain-containing protein [Planobispora rosea]
MRTPVPPRDRGVPARPDAGFTLVEMLVAIAVIGVVMSALAVFFTNSMNFAGQQRGKQVAVQLAGDAIERARALKGTSLAAGRGKTSSEDQWKSAHPKASTYLGSMERAWDKDSALNAGAKAPLPTKPNIVTVNGVKYEQNWYVGHCVQQVVTASAQEQTCVKPGPVSGPADVPFYRVVVAVSWPHKGCENGQCVYVTSTLISSVGDPVFYIKRPAPLIGNPGTSYAYRTVATNLQLTASGGQLPLTWKVTGQPTGLSASESGLISGTPTQLGTSTVTATVTDRRGDTDTVEFSMVVNDLPKLTDVEDQVTQTGTAVSLAIPASGGRTPLTWSATGLPTGLSINALTGVVSGTPTTYQTRSVTVTVTDKGGKTASVAFTWKVLTLKLSDPGTRTDYIRDQISGVRLTPTGGSAPYTWRAENLPDGLQIDASTGEISGTVRWGTRYLSTVYVKDRMGDEVSRTFVWDILARQTNDLRVTAPSPSTPDQTGAAGQQVALTVRASGGSNSGYNTWSATGLPPGLGIAQSGQYDGRITGTPTTPGTYVVELKVVDSAQKWATLMFTWTVR